MLLHKSIIWVIEKKHCSFVKIFCDADISEEIAEKYHSLVSLRYEMLMELIEDEEGECLEKDEEYNPFYAPKLTDYGMLLTFGNLSMHNSEDELSFYSAGKVLVETLETLAEEYPDMHYEGYIAYTTCCTHAGEVCQREISSDKNAYTKDKVYDYIGEIMASVFGDENSWEHFAGKLGYADEDDFKHILKCFHAYSQWLDDSVYDKTLKIADDVLKGEYNDELEEFVDSIKNGENVVLEDDKFEDDKFEDDKFEDDEFEDYWFGNDEFEDDKFEDELDKLATELASFTGMLLFAGDIPERDNAMSTVIEYADKGNTQSQITAALHFIANAKNEDDLARAKEWLRLAAENGSERAAELLKKHLGEE